MTADDAISMPRDLLEALVVAQSVHVSAQAERIAEFLAESITSTERIAALEGEKAELQIKLAFPLSVVPWWFPGLFPGDVEQRLTQE